MVETSTAGPTRLHKTHLFSSDHHQARLNLYTMQLPASGIDENDRCTISEGADDRSHGRGTEVVG